MALNDEDKLKNFENEARGEARKMRDEMKDKIRREFEEKTQSGERKISEEAHEFVRSETEKIKHEKSLEISRVNVKNRQEYFKYGDEIFEKVFKEVDGRLDKFIKNEKGEYDNYLMRSCENILERYGADKIEAHYCKKDEPLVLKIKEKLGNLYKSEISLGMFCDIEFEADESIKNGGLRFFNKTKNIMINDGFDEKKDRAKELLSELIGPHFTAV